MDIFKENIRRFSEQLTSAGLTLVRREALRRGRPDIVVVAGMGGSGLPGELLAGIKDEAGLSVPVVISKTYGLPDLASWRAKRPLYVFVSFSGNTEETLSGLKLCLKSKKKPMVAAITTGGELGRLAERYRLPLVRFPALQLTPRQAVGNMFYGLIELLRQARVSNGVPPFTHLQSDAFRREGKYLAQRLKDRFVYIYTDEADRHLGYFWKISCNEIAKTPAFSNVIPEMNHNEIVGFENRKFKATAIFLVPHKLSERLKKRFALTSELLRRRGVRTVSLPLLGKTRLEQAWRTSMLAEWTTYFLAASYKVNPAETKILDTLKRLMK